MAWGGSPIQRQERSAPRAAVQSPAHLAAEQGHEEVVEQEALGQAWVVEVKEQDGEGQGQILLGRAAESRAQQLQPSHGHKQCPAAVGKRQALGAGRWERVPTPCRPWPGLC